MVEDDLVFQQIIQAFLNHPSMVGTRATMAGNLATAIDRLTPSTDAVLLDLTLPDSHDLDTLHRLREHAPTLPIIILTGLDDDEVAAEAVRRGAQDFIVKTDLTPTLLSRSIRYAIERAKSEAALRASESRFRAVVDDQTELVCRFRPDFTITFVNRAFCRHFDRPESDLLGASFLRLTQADEDRTRHFFAVLTRDEPTGAREQCLAAEGHTQWIQWTDRALFGRDGRLVEFQSVGRDTTEQKELEQQLYQSQKMEMLGQLAGGVAHDFNNLLTVITACCGLLLLETEEQGTEPSPEVLEIEKAAARAASLTQQLLAVSRRHVAQPVVMDLNGIVEQTEEMLRRLIGEQVEVRVRLGEDLGFIKADQAQIEQILVNLVVNARDAMPKGGRLTISTSSWTSQAGGPGAARRWTELTVRDTGIGMSRPTLERIFEPFFTTKKVGEGTGLGLSIVESLVKQGHGQTQVESEAGKGCTFRVRFPVVDGEPKKAPDPDPVEAPMSGSGSILLVEDDASVRSVIRELLAPKGFDVQPAASAEEASDLFDDLERCDLVITDVVLPGRNGFDLARELRGKMPDVPLLFISGYTDAPMPSENLVTAENFLQKPFSANELLGRVHFLLRSR